jgi:glycosyltransferase involved in cell wall biosynthesis
VRVAWLGPVGVEPGGVKYAALQLLEGLHRKGGIEIDCYIAASDSEVPASLAELPGIRLVCRPPRWHWNRSYSRNPLTAFVTGQAARGLVQRRLMELVAEEHARHPYDVLYQFSQIELFGARRLESALPPIVLHPEVHAAGELAWHRREDALAARGESLQKRIAARTVLRGRQLRQRRDIRLARRVIAPSRAFGSHLAADYGVPLDRISVVPNPIDLERFAPALAGRPNGHMPLRVLFVSRLSVRKGLELVTALSWRLVDLERVVRIEIIGNHTLWSDYRALIDDLHPDIASYLGPLDNAELPEVYAGADLVIQPSHYEPFALTVGEALATGTPVVVSSEVGAAESVDRGCCEVFPAGDLNAFEAAVRAMLERIRRGEKPGIARLARAEAQRLFSIDRVTEQVVGALESAQRTG